MKTDNAPNIGDRVRSDSCQMIFHISAVRAEQVEITSISYRADRARSWIKASELTLVADRPWQWRCP